MTKTNRHSIVAVDKFIQATRDSGYKGTASAIAELVDNALQAGADQIDIVVDKTSDDPGYPIEVCVCDNGAGMDPTTLRQAMRFGGSSRFNDRRGMGRYGMGLPNSSLSQARTVTVFSWTKPNRVYSCYLDVDEIAAGEMAEVPPAQRDVYPFDEEYSASGTVVLWTRCDRLDHRRVSSIERNLAAAIGRRFRTFLWSGVRITINGDPVRPVDPLYLHPKAVVTGARIFGEPIRYEVRADPSERTSETGIVEVVFSELPVHEWHALPIDEKRRRGISKGAGVSIVRGGREVDHGWFFMGGKRRENYDDWWRCEVRFDPVLDEAFGITHTKQQVRPQAHLLETLSPDLEAAARALNARARKAYLEVKAAAQFSDAERTISDKDAELGPLPGRGTHRDRTVLTGLKRLNPTLRAPAPSDRTEYRIIVAPTPAKRGSDRFFDHAYEKGRLVLTVNPDHPFYKRVYRPLERSEDPRDHRVKAQLDLMLLSMSRALTCARSDERSALDRFQHRISETYGALLHGN